MPLTNDTIQVLPASWNWTLIATTCPYAAVITIVTPVITVAPPIDMPEARLLARFWPKELKAAVLLEAALAAAETIAVIAEETNGAPAVKLLTKLLILTVPRFFRDVARELIPPAFTLARLLEAVATD